MNLIIQRTFLTLVVAAVALATATCSAGAPPQPRPPAAGAGRALAATNSAHDADAEALAGFEQLQRARETADPARYAGAELAFEAALDIEPDHLDALIGLGTLALARHDFAGALQIGERARLIGPGVARVYGVIGDAQIELGRYDDALGTIQHMVDLRPDLASYSRVSYLRELHGDLAGATEAMELAVEAGGPSAENIEYVRTQLAHLQFAGGDLHGAEETLQGALTALPDYPHALAGLGRVRAAQGRADEAIDLFARAAEQVPLPEFVIALGETFEAAGRTSEAAEQYALVDAMQQLFRANGVQTDLEMALFYADHGDPATAVDLARDAYADAPSVRAADALAWALYRAGRAEEAAPYADEAMRIGSHDSRMLFHAGLVAMATGDSDVALERLDLALELNPAFGPLDAPAAAAALVELETE